MFVFVTVPDADRAELERRARSKGAPARVAERARVVLLAAAGLTGAQIAERAGCTEPAVVKWRRRYAGCGLAGLEDAPRPGGPGRHTRGYVRHGTTALPAALEAATGTVTDACHPRRRHGEFLRFGKKAAAAYPGCELRVMCDNYATHKHADVREWLARPDNQQITLHFVPASCSWLNLAVRHEVACDEWRSLKGDRLMSVT